jgi:hypothetical protein
MERAGMREDRRFRRWFTARQLQVLRRLDGPAAIQRFLDRIEYATDEVYRAPGQVMSERKANCFDGALFAAAALRRLGERPLILELHAENDDCHLLALFKRRGRWGAMAKSNFTGLRYREPVFGNLRELALSYCESFFNVRRQKTLRGASATLNLATLARLEWMRTADGYEEIGERLDALPRQRLIPPQMARQLAPVDERTYRAGLLGAKKRGLFSPA